MFEEFFENNAPVDEENPSEESREQIRTAVMERISRESEDKKMKHRFMRPFIIVAAAVSVSTACLVTANAATNGALVDTITKPFTIFLNGEPVEVEATLREVEMEDGEKGGVLTISLPDGDDDVWISTKDVGDTEVSYYYYSFDGDTVTSEAPDADSWTVNTDGNDETYYWTDANGEIEAVSAGEAEADADAWTVNTDGNGESSDVYYYQYDGENVTAIPAEEFNAAEA